MRGHRRRSSDGGWGGRSVHPTHKFERMWPQQRGIRIEAEHKLRLTPHDMLGQPVPETLCGPGGAGEHADSSLTGPVGIHRHLPRPVRAITCEEQPSEGLPVS